MLTSPDRYAVVDANGGRVVFVDVTKAHALADSWNAKGINAAPHRVESIGHRTNR